MLNRSLISFVLSHKFESSDVTPNAGRELLASFKSAEPLE